jgi:hypothetical protein
MDSKIIMIAAIALTGCGSSPRRAGIGVIGNPLIGQTSLYNNYGIETKQVFVVDKSTNRLLGVSLDSMSITREFELSHPEVEHSVAIDTNEKFVIDFSKSHLQTISMDGTRTDKPFKFQGTPIASAYNPLTRTMIMQDDLYSVGLIKFTEIGGVASSWLGGPTIATGKTISAGDLDRSGRLILAMTDGTFSVVDVDQSISKESWQSTNFTTTLKSINWVAPDTSSADLSLVSSSTDVGVVNVATQAVTESQSISVYSRAVSKAGKPHVITKASIDSDYTMYYLNASGALTTYTLKDTGSGTYSKSYLSSDASQLSVLLKVETDKYRNTYQLRALAVRLSDGLVLHDRTVTAKGAVSMDSQFLFVNQDAALGKLQLFDMETDDVKTIQGYNFNYLRTH